MKKGKQTILVVDDEPQNLHLMKQNLQNVYQLSFATSGTKAIELAGKIQPDLILLDIMMPDIDGYETCRKIKHDSHTKNMVIIFVSSMGEVEDQSKGFELGAVDFITKPIQPALLLARIRTHLELKSARDLLVEQNRILTENMKLREDIEQITRHDLKSPLSGIINYPYLVKTSGDVNEKQDKYLNEITDLGQSMLNMINLSHDMYKMEQGIYKFDPERIDLVSIIDRIFLEQNAAMKKKQVGYQIINKATPETSSFFEIAGEPLLVYSMFSNIIKNAIEASPANKEITLCLEVTDALVIEIHNVGAVPREIRDRFFDKYVTAGKDKGSGLGTYSARLMAEIQKGKIELNTSEEFGTSVIFSFPPTSEVLPSDSAKMHDSPSQV